MLANIVAEFYRRFQLSSDVFIDAVGAKKIFDNTAIQTNRVQGFIHSIGLHPYGFLLFSEIQVL